MELVEEKVLVGPSAPEIQEGVAIRDCSFTETEGEVKKRPPLHRIRESRTGNITNGVFLAVPGGKIKVKEPTDNLHPFTDGVRIGGFVPEPPMGPLYTGPITPAMWTEIRKWWNA